MADHNHRNAHSDHAGWDGARDIAPPVLPSALSSASAPESKGLFAAQWLAYALPCRRFADTLAEADARLGADVDRCSFIAVDLHHLLFAGFDRRTRNQEFRKDCTSSIINYINWLLCCKICVRDCLGFCRLRLRESRVSQAWERRKSARHPGDMG